MITVIDDDGEAIIIPETKEGELFDLCSDSVREARESALRAQRETWDQWEKAFEKLKEGMNEPYQPPSQYIVAHPKVVAQYEQLLAEDERFYNNYPSTSGFQENLLIEGKPVYWDKNVNDNTMFFLDTKAWKTVVLDTETPTWAVKEEE